MATLRLGLIGSGDIVRKRVAPALRDLANCELLAVSRAQPALAEAFTQAVARANGWLIKREQAGGGPMFDFGCHRLELLVNLFGPVRRVASIIGNVVAHAFFGQIPPHIEEAGLARLDKRLLDVVREFSDRYLQFL